MNLNVLMMRSLVKRTSNFSAILLMLVFTSCKQYPFFFDDDCKSDSQYEDYVDALLFRDSTETDHAMIQMAIDYAADNGINKVFVPDGEYWVDATEVNGTRGLVLRDSIHLCMSDSAVIKAIPNGETRYYILSVHDVVGVNITGGTILGERDAHTGSGGEWGMGIDVRKSSNIQIEGVTVKDCWGDGILIAENSQNIEIDNVLCYNNRRQGMSVIQVDGLVVRNSEFSNTNGTAPQAGIDLEPDRGGTQQVKNVLISNCRFLNNAGRGILVAGLHGKIHLTTIDSCFFDGNGGAIHVEQDASDIGISNIEINSSGFHGITLAYGAKRVQVGNVSIRDVTEDGIRCREVEDVEISSIDAVNNVAWGIGIIESQGIHISDVRIHSDSLALGGIRVASSDTVSISDSDIKGGKIGVSFGLTSSSIAKRNRVSKSSTNAFNLWNSNNCIIDSAEIDSISSTNIVFNGSNNNQLRNSEITGGAFAAHNTYQFVLFSGTSTGNVFEDNMIESGLGTNKAKFGIRFLSATNNNTASNNVIDSAAYTFAAYTDESGGLNFYD